MARRALIVGCNTYQNFGSLSACVNDAQGMTDVLRRHKDDDLNFDCRTWLDATPEGRPITRAELRKAIVSLFNYDGDALFYFSGHGYLGKTGGYVCTTDAAPEDWGIPMQEIVDLASQSRAREILIIMDCCHAGDTGNAPVFNAGGAKTDNPLASIREGMSIIAASRNTEVAIEAGGNGLFTAALLDALEGGAADHMGYVTAPALYSYVSRRFRSWDQRPVFKTNATDVLVVRECEPLIDRLQLRQMPHLFLTADYKYPLDAEHEPEDEFGNVKEPVNHDKVGVAKLFKAYRDAGLLKPSDPTLQLYWVARKNSTVELTKLGREYWWLITNNKV